MAPFTSHTVSSHTLFENSQKLKACFHTAHLALALSADHALGGMR